MTLMRTRDFFTSQSTSEETNSTISQASRLALDLADRDPEVARFLASGMLRYMACRLGGDCYCGKPVEEREVIEAAGSLLPTLELCLRHWLASQAEGRHKAIAQIREQWPAGLLVSDEVASETGASEDAMGLLAELAEAAGRSPRPETTALPEGARP